MIKSNVSPKTWITLLIGGLNKSILPKVSRIFPRNIPLTRDQERGSAFIIL